MNQIKYIILLIICAGNFAYSQHDQKISSMDFVQIQNNHVAEAMHYYENNWKVLRIQAKEKGYIDSYQIMKTDYTEDAPFHLILITTYKNKAQFENRETHFQELIKGLGGLNLLNEKTPEEFRKTLFGTDAKHLN